MNVVTDQYDNISINALVTKLSSKYAELNKIDQEEKVEAIRQKDYIDDSSLYKSYDEQDFARVMEKFKTKDAEVRTHEQAHASIGHTTTPISYSYQQGPDGKMYAVGGSVRLDTSIPKDPDAASFKLDMIKRAASAPTDTSVADGAIASQSSLNKILLELQGENNAN